jgi:predicted lipoprotein with Yx(FWY)xxD motif
MTRACAGLLLMLLPLVACREARDQVSPQVDTRLGVADAPDVGRYLTDANGRAVYTLAGDAKRESSCYEACRAAWLPVPGANPPAQSTEPAIQPELVGATARRDGITQLTYNGHALYFRQSSPSTGTPERVVRDQFGTWSLLFPHGEPMFTPGQ